MKSLLLSLALFSFAVSTAPANALAAAPAIAVGHPAPNFTYHLLGGARLSAGSLRGHRYLLWVMATWCPSCVTGAHALAAHAAKLRRAGFRMVQLEAAGDLGYPGPSLESIRNSIGAVAAPPNWYWGTLSEAQSLALDPASAPDVFYLVDRHGRVRAQSSAPAAHWAQISAFASGR